MRARSWWPWAALAAVLVVVVVVLVVRSTPDDSAAARANRLAGEINCPDCAGESVANSNTAAARAIRADLRERVDAGAPDDEILAFYESRFPGSRRTPDSDGVGILVWGIPVVVLVAGFGGIVLALRRWSRQPRLTASADDERLVERARQPGRAT
jgi:cytochrome c-type biogenesis protein CcmH